MRCYPTVKKSDNTFSRFYTIPAACDRQTDGDTDRQTSCDRAIKIIGN